MPKGKGKGKGYNSGGNAMYHNSDYSGRKISSSETAPRGEFEGRSGVKNYTPSGTGKPKRD